jgi:hypothetical protein
VTCFDSQVIQRMTLFVLDECGRIPTDASNPTPALKGLSDTITQVVRSRNLTLPTDNTVKVVSGRTCSKPRGTPTDLGYNYTINFCGPNPVFESAVGFVDLDMDGETIVGWEDNNISSSTFAALELVFTPSADACEPGETPQCRALLIPMLEQWVRGGDETFNGNDVSDLVMTGTTRKNGNLFDNYADVSELPTYLGHWAPKFADIATGRAWSYNRLIDCPAEDVESACEFSPIETGS